jgi:hypothetical protein
MILVIKNDKRNQSRWINTVSERGHVDVIVKEPQIYNQEIGNDPNNVRTESTDIF